MTRILRNGVLALLFTAVLSVGGSYLWLRTSLPRTTGTIDFAESFNHIQNGELSFDETVTAFVSSIENLLNKYHMEGIDIDVECCFSCLLFCCSITEMELDGCCSCSVI